MSKTYRFRKDKKKNKYKKNNHNGFDNRDEMFYVKMNKFVKEPSEKENYKKFSFSEEDV